MNVWVVLLRGINVGGHRKVPMADLKAAYRSVGCDPVLTYIASGNVVVGSAQSDPAELASVLRSALIEACAVDAALMVRSAAEWRALVAANPFPASAAADLHLSLLDVPAPAASAASVATLTERSGGPEEVAVRGSTAYWRLPDGVRAAGPLLAGAERILGPSTMRNWRTVERIGLLLDEAETEALAPAAAATTPRRKGGPAVRSPG